MLFSGSLSTRFCGEQSREIRPKFVFTLLSAVSFDNGIEQHNSNQANRELIATVISKLILHVCHRFSRTNFVVFVFLCFVCCWFLLRLEHLAGWICAHYKSYYYNYYLLRAVAD